jgi:Glycosyl hydrolase family 62
MRSSSCFAVLIALFPAGLTAQAAQKTDESHAVENLLAGRFNWTVSPPLIAPLQRPGELIYSVKDPTIVRYKNQWHLFCTIRGKPRSHRIEYLRFDDWHSVDKTERHILKLSDGYFCAPEVFYFTPRKGWYMIYQVIDKTRKPALQPAYSTSPDLADPNSWTKPELLFRTQPQNVKHWIDFWVICDARSAYLFFTSNDGRMWRSETKLAEFPHGWSQPVVVLHGDVFEASHTYRLKGLDKFLTIIEAQADGRRYYKAYLAEALDGSWRPLAAARDKPFASPVNTRDVGSHWTDSFSHGELIRDGFDQTLTVDPANIRLLFQGVSDEDKAGKKYGEIPWRLGILSPREADY